MNTNRKHRLELRHGQWTLLLAGPLLATTIWLSGSADTAPVAAMDRCATDVAVCLVVNTPEDTDARDDALSLREALQLSQGSLTLDELSTEEWRQVIITMPPGWGPADTLQPLMPPGFGGPGGIGSMAVLFDTDVFCAGCTSRTISLLPEAAFSAQSRSIVTLAGSPAALPVVAPPPGSAAARAAWRVRIGNGRVPGSDDSAPVILDGSKLSPGALGLAIDGPGVRLQGIAFQHFPGAAVTLSCAAAGTVALDVEFAENGTDIATLGCPPEAP